MTAAHPPCHILLVDDQPIITSNLTPYLERAGFKVTTVADGEAGVAAIQETQPDLIVLDVLMPRLDGREVLRRIRQAGNWTPVILLTQVGDPAERAGALDEGADDYLNKPFEPYELLARIRAIIRRSRAGKPLAMCRKLRCGPLEIDRLSRRALLDYKDLPLTAKAVSVLEYLMLHPNEVCSRERLLDAVWGWEYPAATRAVDVRIAELRRALNDNAEAPRFLDTLIGQGYAFIGQVEAVS